MVEARTKGLFVPLHVRAKLNIERRATRKPYFVQVKRYGGSDLYKFEFDMDFISRNPDAYIQLEGIQIQKHYKLYIL